MASFAVQASSVRGVSSDVGIPQWQASQEAAAPGPGQEDLCDKLLLRIASGGEV